MENQLEPINSNEKSKPLTSKKTWINPKVSTVELNDIPGQKVDEGAEFTLFTGS